MLDLSVIIVNYNVKYFLHQAVESAYKACKNIQAEIIVIDNHSKDGSLTFFEDSFPTDKYPNLRLIQSQENLGFSKGNNLGIKESKGKYVLLLNPDTIVPEDCFEKCLQFMESNSKAGALGVHMIDGKGEFLPESKRGLPTPTVSFYKMSGLSKLFPKSKKFGRYHLGFLDKDKTNEVDILSGAFMFMRKEALDKVGLLDEKFFMYGEDIDLSYRIQKGGYENYYFADTSIIHFKGESTKKESRHYVKVFYGAMRIFVQKHFGGSGASIISSLLNLAIFLRAGAAVLQRIAKSLFHPLMDFLIIYLGYITIAKYWEAYNKWVKAIYPDEYYLYHIPAYILFIIISIYFSGGYSKPISSKRIFRGIALGGFILIGLYGLAPKSLQFSRAILGLGVLWSFIGVFIVRIIVQFILHGNIELGTARKKRAVYVGIASVVEDYLNDVRRSLQKTKVIGVISLEDKLENAHTPYLGKLSESINIVDLYQINEYQFCINQFSYKAMIDIMNELHHSGKNLSYKIIDKEKQYVIGSDSKNSTGMLWSYDLNPAYFSTEMKRKKRYVDLAICLLTPLLIPLILLKGKTKIIKNWGKVLLGEYTWIAPTNWGNPMIALPKKGVYSPCSNLTGIENSEHHKMNISKSYILEYEPITDIKIFTRILLQ